MFTTIAFLLVALLAWMGSRGNNKDREAYEQSRGTEGIWLLTLHIRQDLKLATFFLGGVIVMLGVVADRMH